MVTGDGRVSCDQVGLVGVAAQVGPDERTLRDELEPTGAEILQGAGDQPLAQPLAREGGVDLGMDQEYHAWLGQVLDEAGAGRSQPELVARRPRIVGDSGLCSRSKSSPQTANHQDQVIAAHLDGHYLQAHPARLGEGAAPN